MKKNKVKGLLNGYLTWPLILIMLFAIMTIHMFIINIKSGSVAFIYFAVYAAIAVFLYNYKTSAISARHICSKKWIFPTLIYQYPETFYGQMMHSPKLQDTLSKENEVTR